jgi:hypothetical protein
VGPCSGALGYFGLPRTLALLEATYFVGLRNAGAGKMSFGFMIYPRSRKSPHRAQGAPLPPHPRSRG